MRPITSASSRPHLGRDARGALGCRHERGAPGGERAVPGGGVEAGPIPPPRGGSRPWRRAPALRRAIWRFATDPDAALNLVLSHEADVLETRGRPRPRATRRARDSSAPARPLPLGRVRLPRLQPGQCRGAAAPHPGLRRSATRRGLALAVDRVHARRARCSGAAAKAPPGPMSQLLWIWNDSIATLPFDQRAAERALDAARVAAGGSRRPGRGTAGGWPSTFWCRARAPRRRQLAVPLQAMWQPAGAAVTVTSVDFPVFQERLGQGQFDSYIGAWLDEPSARGLADQWTRAGWAALNYGHYANPAFDSLFARAGRTPSVAEAGRAYRERWTRSMPTRRRSSSTPRPTRPWCRPGSRDLEINPYSWASGLRNWRVE